MKFPTLILSVPLFLVMLTDKDWFPFILLTIMGQGSSTEGSRVSSRSSQNTHGICTVFFKTDFITHFH